MIACACIHMLRYLLKFARVWNHWIILVRTCQKKWQHPEWWFRPPKAFGSSETEMMNYAENDNFPHRFAKYNKVIFKLTSFRIYVWIWPDYESFWLKVGLFTCKPLYFSADYGLVSVWVVDLVSDYIIITNSQSNQLMSWIFLTKRLLINIAFVG